MATRLSNESYGLALQKADTHPMPVHIPLDQKSPRVVALQLIKRFRDKRYREHDDHRGKHKPPSVIIAAVAIGLGPANDSLVDEVIAIAKRMRWQIRNPAHYLDLFTDRWPAQRSDQQLWAADLLTLIERLENLKQIGFNPAVIQSTFDDLFGEKAGETALQAYHRAQTVHLEHGALGMTRSGQLKPAAPVSSPAAPALGIGVASAPDLVKPARANTNMGGTVSNDKCW